MSQRQLVRVRSKAPFADQPESMTCVERAAAPVMDSASPGLSEPLVAVQVNEIRNTFAPRADTQRGDCRDTCLSPATDPSCRSVFVQRRDFGADQSAGSMVTSSDSESAEDADESLELYFAVRAKSYVCWTAPAERHQMARKCKTLRCFMWQWPCLPLRHHGSAWPTSMLLRA